MLLYYFIPVSVSSADTNNRNGSKIKNKQTKRHILKVASQKPRGFLKARLVVVVVVGPVINPAQ